MDKWKMRIFFLTGVMACFTFLLSHAQPIVKASADKNEILIGDQFTLKIELDFDEDVYRLKSLVIPDSLQHFEILNRGKIDSLYSNTRLSGITQQFKITSFDSGKWTLPSFTVQLASVSDDTAIMLFTDSLPVTVSFSASDTTNQLRDIKPIRQADTVNTLWYWIGAAILLIALIIFLIWFYRYWKKNKGLVPFQSKSSPYDEAKKELANLQQYSLSSPVEIRTFHTRLTEILKRYLSRTQGNNYLTKTTGDILVVLSQAILNKEIVSGVAASLRCGDAVKFAKYIPPTDVSESCLQSIKEIIGDLQQNVKPSKPSTSTLSHKP